MEPVVHFTPNHYCTLGVTINASPEAVKMAYRKLARKWHPDRHRGDSQSTRKFQDIQNAYEVLCDGRRRQHYDLGLLELLGVEEYLTRFQDFILTTNGLGMAFCCPQESSAPVKCQTPALANGTNICFQQQTKEVWKLTSAC